MRARTVWGWLFVLAFIVLAIFQDATAAGKLTLDELKKLLELGVDQTEIIRVVKDADTLELTKEDIPKLRQWGAKDELVNIIEGILSGPIREFTLDTVLQMVKESRSEQEIIEKIHSSGISFELSASDMLKLVRANVSNNIILALKGEHVFLGYRSYKDPLGNLSIQYPKDWNIYEWYTGEGFKILFSPETGVAQPNQFKTGLQIQLSFVEEYSLLSKLDIVEFHRRTLPAWLRANRMFNVAVVSGPGGEPTPIYVGGHPGLKQKFTVTMVNTPCLETMVRCRADEVYFFMEFVAPEDKFGEQEDKFDTMLKTCRFFPDRTRLERKSRELKSSDLLDRYREAVIQVKTEYGYGSGFFVREDGYVLTNHHVICLKKDHSGCSDLSQMKLAKNISVQWDRKVGPKQPGETYRKIEAKLEDTIYRVSPKIDLALLSVPRGRKPYQTIPLSPISSGLVHEGDRMVALGFPLPNRLGVSNLFTTEGIISRFNYLERKFGKRETTKRLDDLITTAEIQQGNSGGPAINLATGGVIGLNTYNPLTPARLTLEGKDYRYLKELDYFGVCPTDHALYHFPQIRWYPRKRKMAAQEHLELGAMLLTQKNFRAAGIELSRALKEVADLNPDQRARLYYQLYLYLQGIEQPEYAKQMLEQCLGVDESYPDALRIRAYNHANANEMDKAIAIADKLVKKQPDAWQPLYDRAEIFRRAKRYDEALKNLQSALERGGGYASGIYGLQGNIYFEMNELEKGLASFKKAIEINHDDLEAHVAIAKYYHLKKNDDGAILEYGRIVSDHSDEPFVHENYGNFLQQLKDRQDKALDEFAQALVLNLDREEKPSFSLLKNIGELSRKQPGQSANLPVVAQLLYQYHPKSSHWAHNFLAHFWDSQYLVATDSQIKSGKDVIAEVKAGQPLEKIGEKDDWFLVRGSIDDKTVSGYIHKNVVSSMDAVERAHSLASDRLYRLNWGGEQQTAAGYAPEPLTLMQLVWVTEMGYGPGLLQETLAETNLGFLLTSKRLEIFKNELKWDRWQIIVVMMRYLEDQSEGGETLGPMLKVKLDEKNLHAGKEDVYGIYSFENTSELPLASVVLRKRYFDKKEKVLWTSEKELVTRDPLFLPGQKRQFELHYDSWKTLQQAGVRKENIDTYQTKVISARNAIALLQLKFEDTKVTGSSYQFKIMNPTLFAVRNIKVRANYTDKKRNSIRHRSSGQPVYTPVTTIDSVIPPESKSETVVIKKWADPSYFSNLGVPAGVAPYLDPIIVDVELVLY
jgi:tetratricopeptide (TPR) repeat protein